MTFGWALCRHVKSNAIVFAHSDRAAAIGAGQMSRVDSSKLAVMKATDSLDGSIVASDAFFPFPDGVEAAAAAACAGREDGEQWVCLAGWGERHAALQRGRTAGAPSREGPWSFCLVASSDAAVLIIEPPE